MQKSTIIKKADNKQNWYLIDATGINLGKLAVQASKLLIGKGKTTYASNLFSGDNVIIINSKKVQISPKKFTTKTYHKHSGFQGGLKTITFDKMMDKNPTVVIKSAIKGMVPKTKMGDEMLRHLHLYNDEKFEQTAQNPIKL